MIVVRMHAVSGSLSWDVEPLATGKGATDPPPLHVHMLLDCGSLQEREPVLKHALGRRVLMMNAGAAQHTASKPQERTV